jgi:hypothetical protein
MPRSAFSAAFLFIVVTALPGCMQGAKLIHQDATSGVVSIPENSNVWPTYYRDSAYQKIREVYPAFNPRVDIIEQGEYVVGQQTHNDQRVDRRQFGPDGKPTGELTLNSNTTTTTDLKEFRITFRIPQSPLTNSSGPSGNLLRQTSGGPRPGIEQFPGRSGLNNSSFNMDPVPTNSTFGNR